MGANQRDEDMIKFLTVSLEEEVKAKFHYAEYINSADANKRMADKTKGVSDETKVLCAMSMGFARAWYSEACRHIDYLSIELYKAGLSGKEVYSLIDELEERYKPNKRAAKRGRAKTP